MAEVQNYFSDFGAKDCIVSETNWEKLYNPRT